MLITINNSVLIHEINNPVIVDNDFAYSLDRIIGYAVSSGVRLYITSSFRKLDQKIIGAVVPPAKKSCHYAGHAIDFNVFHDGDMYGSKVLVRSNLLLLPEPVQKFIDCVRRDNDLRWGGDFLQPDPIHIDDNLYNRDRATYTAKVLQYNQEA